MSTPTPAPPPPTPPPGAFDLLPGHSTAPPRPRDANDLLPPPGSVPPREPYVAPRPPLPVAKIVAVASALSFVFFAWAVWPRDSGNAASDTEMEVLPRNGDGELSMDIDNAFRVQSESNLRMATVAVQMVYAEYGDLTMLTPETLSRYEPSATFVPGGSASTSANIVSLQTGPDRAVLAVGGDTDICAFARIDSAGMLETVTVRTSGECRASAAPDIGWEGLASAGGSGVPLAPEIPTGPAEEDLYPT